MRALRTWMMTLLIVGACSLAVWAEATSQPAEDPLYKPVRGAWAVKVVDETWHDAARVRDVPVRMYVPQSESPVKLPVVIFSHGWGGSRTSYGYFCQHLASNGYLVISPTHFGSDTSSIALGTNRASGNMTPRPLERLRTLSASSRRGSLLESVEDPDNLRNRPKDVSFIIDQLATNTVVKNMADMDRIGVAGHSFGAYTAMVEGGMLVDLPEGKKQSLRDPRVKAVLPMSPEGRGTMGIASGAWEKFAVPVMFLTGTKDYGSGERPAAWRREAFDSIHNIEAYLVTIADATHFTFAFPDRGATTRGSSLKPTEATGADGRLIDSLGIAFFDAKLLNDVKAKAWLKSYFATAHANATAESEAAGRED